MIAFTVYGKPQPQGSTRMFPIKTPTGNHMVLTSANRKLKPWRQEVASMALQARAVGRVNMAEAFNRPVRVRTNCYFAPPKKMPSGRTGMTVKPDIDKILRGILDSLTGILYKDDAQVVEALAVKLYGLPERAEIEVEYF